MKQLSYRKVFSKYNTSFADKLARASFTIYKNVRTYFSKLLPLNEHQKYSFEDHRKGKKVSDSMPSGYNYVTETPETSYLNLEYIDFFDYLPKENLDQFKKNLKRSIRRNKLSHFGPLWDHRNNDSIDNMGRFTDRMAFSNLSVINLGHNAYLERYAPHLSVSLHNLSSSFLVVKYRLYINENFNQELNKVCNEQFDNYSDVYRQLNIPWYKPKKFGRSFYTGNDARKRELYKLISHLKWQAYLEIKNTFKIYFACDFLYPPTFETYSTNIRPNKDKQNRGFWSSVMLNHDTDYSLKYNSCVCWDYDCSKNEGIRLAAYCGGNYSKEDRLPEIAQHDISDIYTVYLTASSIRRIAERDIAICNKKISKAIRKARTSSVLKVRVKVERKLYYCYRFISEFSGDTIEQDDIDYFKSIFYKKGSITSHCLKDISEFTTGTKKQIDNILKILNDAAEYGSSKSNINLQWMMILITIMSLVIAVIAIINSDGALLKSISDTVIHFLETIFINK